MRKGRTIFLQKEEKCAMLYASRKDLQAALLPGTTNAGEVMHMSDYEILMIVFTVIGLLLTVFGLSAKRR